MANKVYPIHQSPFFKLQSKRRLSNLLLIPSTDLVELQSDTFFRVFMDGKREIQEPKGKLRRVHDIIQKHISSINVPAYLFSGVKGKSSVENAKHHLACRYMLTTDISGFFRNSKKEFIKRMFLHDFYTAPDIAHILAEIICYRDIVPTGSPLSQSVAFWSHKYLFDLIDKVSRERRIDFTLYVDDMTFSSQTKIPIGFKGTIKHILSTHKLAIKNGKTHSYSTTDYKNVTGCIIDGKNKLKVSNKHKKKVVSLLRSSNENCRSLQGLIAYCQSIEPKIFEKTNIMLKEINTSI